MSWAEVKKYRKKIGTKLKKMPIYHNDYQIEDVPIYETRYAVIQDNKTIKEFKTKSSATRFKNKINSNKESIK